MIKGKCRLTAFVCIRLNNERLPGKNLLELGGKPLYYWIFKELKKITTLDKIYLYSSTLEEYEKLPDGIDWMPRDPSYDKNVSCIELLQSFCRLVNSDYYLLAHATSPFTKAETLGSMINKFSESTEFDSAFTGNTINSFLWENDKPFNFNPSNILRTQDMTKLFVENVGGYLFSREQILEHGRRVGRRPLLWETPKIESIDIDNLADYEFAHSIDFILKE